MATQEKKVALVTGASVGIGRGIAQYLLMADYRVIMVARNGEQLQETCTEVTAKGHTIDAIPLVVDITEGKQLNEVLLPAIEREGRIDLLVNNAGYCKRGTSELAHAELLKMLEVNLVAAFDIVQLVVPLMRQQRSGRIINIASQSGISVRRYSGGYGASKFALVGLNEALHKELAPDGIAVTAICPGYVATPMTDDVKIVALEDMMPVADIVNTVDYLLSLSPNAMIKSLVINSRGQLLNWIDT
ncbi:MAG: SDR family oxidoreductase [Gammaproteobacteria bacterium]|nr:SDR family oxidoreductase [Gammaproteobacteria bacterium]